ncbi:Eukaryotic translation initiation factor 3 110 kDa subunit [Vibrio chagasii]|nr:Eukaryotic translation initiation factor 3 110 kDa subunit [Vibrio chagasii]
MLKPVNKVQQGSDSAYCELTHMDLLREVGSLDEYQRELLKDREYQEEADKRIALIRENMRQHEQARLASQEEALLEQSRSQKKRRDELEQLGGTNE